MGERSPKPAKPPTKPPPPGQAYGGPSPTALRRSGWRGPLLPARAKALVLAIGLRTGRSPREVLLDGLRAIATAEELAETGQPAPLPMPSQAHLDHALYWVGENSEALDTVLLLIDIARGARAIATAEELTEMEQNDSGK